MPIVVDKEKKAEAIGSAALHEFRKLGYHETRMADIASAAGIGKGTLYEYFNDKTDILRFVFQRYFDAFRAGSVAALQEVEGPAEKLFALIDFAFGHVAEWEDHCAVFVDYFSAARIGQEGSFSLDDIYDVMTAMLEQLVVEGIQAGELRKDMDPVATAELLVSVFDGIVLHGVLTERGCGIDRLHDEARKVISRGVIEEPESNASGIGKRGAATR